MAQARTHHSQHVWVNGEQTTHYHSRTQTSINLHIPLAAPPVDILNQTSRCQCKQQFSECIKWIRCSVRSPNVNIIFNLRAIPPNQTCHIFQSALLRRNVDDVLYGHGIVHSLRHLYRIYSHCLHISWLVNVSVSILCAVTLSMAILRLTLLCVHYH